MRSQNPTLPLHVTQTYGIGQGLAFDVQAGGGDVSDFCCANSPDTEAFLIRRRDEATAGQARQGFA
ncbi:hypothetical protein D3C76_1824000 [compost metagenome]